MRRENEDVRGLPRPLLGAERRLERRLSHHDGVACYVELTASRLTHMRVRIFSSYPSGSGGRQQVKEPLTATFVLPDANVTTPESVAALRLGVSFSFIASPMYCLPLRAI
jgi:hypothetical protein